MNTTDGITVRDIVARCASAECPNGAERIANESENTVSKWAVYKWLHNGIPEKRWPLVKRLAGVTADELHSANQQLALQAAD